MRHLPLTLACLLLAGCSSVPITGRSQLNLIPAAELSASAAASYQQLLSESKLSTDAAANTMLERVGRRIAASAEQFLRENGREGDIKGFAWEFRLIDDAKTVNAFAMPGGKVAFYTGILPLTQGEDGVAVVMGHEVAHVIANHGGERMSQSLLVQLGGASLALALQKKPAETQQLLLAAYGVGANVGMMLPFSRKHEYEADRIGLILMARAGYRPEAAVAFWQRMGALGGQKPPEFLSTHPSDDKRVENLRAELPGALKYYQPR